MDPIIRERLSMSLTLEFFQHLQSELEWVGDKAWQNNFDPVGLVGPIRCVDDVDLSLQRLRRERRLLGGEALMRTSTKLGIPCYTLRPGGHIVVIAELGETLVVLEPGDYVGDRSSRAAYKLEMALQGLGRAREPFLPFIPPLQSMVSSGGMLVVVQHIVSLASANRVDHELVDLRLIVPDESLNSTLVNLSVINDLFDVHLGVGNDAPAPQKNAQPRLRQIPRRREKVRIEDQERGEG